MEQVEQRLLRNNRGIEFDELELRLQAIERRMTTPQAAPAHEALQLTASPPPLPARAAPSLPRKMAELLVCFARLRRIREWAEIGRDTRGYAEAIHHDLRRTGETAATRDNQLQEQVRQLQEHVREVQHQFQEQQQQLEASLAKTRAEHGRQLDAANARSAELGRELAQVRTQAAELERTNQELRQEILFQQRRLTRMATATEASPGTAPPSAPATRIADGRLDAFYIAFEDRFRGSRADIKDRMRALVAPLARSGAGSPEHPIVDLGCGRGEWLELLREEQLTAYGVDGNAMMIERARALGLDARHDDLTKHLGELPDMCRSAVTAFHVVEHLPFATLIDFLDEALRVLVPGGMLIIETPNIETMRVGATTFHYDPTHLLPLPPLPLSFMVEHRGFVSVEVIKRHPFTEGLLEAGTADAELLNRVLFGPQDCTIIARRG